MMGGARSVVCVRVLHDGGAVLAMGSHARSHRTLLLFSSRAISHREMPPLEGGEGEGRATEKASIVAQTPQGPSAIRNDGLFVAGTKHRGTGTGTSLFF